MNWSVSFHEHFHWYCPQTNVAGPYQIGLPPSERIGAIRQQAIEETNIDYDPWCLMASLDHIELKGYRYVQIIFLLRVGRWNKQTGQYLKSTHC